MAEITTSYEDAVMLNNNIQSCVKDLLRLGFAKSQIGPALAGVGLAISHKNGVNFDDVVSACRQAIEDDD